MKSITALIVVFLSLALPLVALAQKPAPPQPVDPAVVQLVPLTDRAVPGEEIELRVRIGKNPTGMTPGAVAFRVFYDRTQAEFLGVRGAQLGNAMAGPQKGNTLSSHQDVLTQSNMKNRNMTPEVMTLRFRLRENAYGRIQFRLDDDPDAVNPLLDINLQNIPHIFDYSKAEFFALPPDDAARVELSLLTPEPIQAGETIQLRVRVSENPTGLTPAQASLRINFNSDQAEFLSVTGGELGGVFQGQQEGPEPNVFIDVPTQSELTNTNPTPDIMTFDFRVRDDAEGLVEFSISADPDAESALADSNLETIPAFFDNDNASFEVFDEPDPITIRFRTLTSPPIRPGDTVEMIAEVSSNPAGQTPIAGSFRIRYNSEFLQFERAEPIDLGPVDAGPLEGIAPDSFQDFTAGPSFGASEQLPGFFRLFFTVQNAAEDQTINLTIEDDPDEQNPVIDSNLAPIPRLYNNEGARFRVSESIDPAVIRFTAESAGPIFPGDTITFLAEISENFTGLTPANAAFRLNYDGSLLAFESIEAGQIGEFSTGSEQGGSPNNFRNFFTPTNSDNNDPTPTLFRLTFRALEGVEGATALSLGDDPDADFNLANSPGTEIPHNFVNDASVTIVPRPVEAVVDFFLETPEPIRQGDTIRFRVEVSENGTGQTPVAMATIINFRSDQLEFVLAQGLELGGTAISLENGGEPPNVFRTIITQSNFGNSNPTPGVYTAEFVVLADPFTLIAPTLEDDPTADDPLLSNALEPIPHVIDSSGATFTVALDPAIVGIEVLTPQPIFPGETVEARIAVVENPTGQVPSSASVRLGYSDFLQFDRVRAGDLGAPAAGQNPEGSPPDLFRDVVVSPDLSNSEETPVLFTAEFTAAEEGEGSLEASADPDSLAPLLDLTASPIPADFAPEAVVSVIDPEPAEIALELITPEPIVPGGEVLLQAAVANNNTTRDPAGGEFLLSYNGELLEFLDAQAGDLGAPEVTTAKGVTDQLMIAVDGESVGPAPALFQLRFAVADTQTGLVEFTLQDSQTAMLPFFDDLGRNIPRVYTTDAAAFEIAELAPSAPVTPSPIDDAEAVEIRDVVLDWADSANAATYDVFFAASGDFPGDPIATGLTESEWAVSQQLLTATTYQWTIRANSPLGTEQTSGPLWSFTTRDPAPVTIALEPAAGFPISVDSELRETPMTIIWEEGTSHTISVPQIQPGAEGERYVFLQWADGESATARAVLAGPDGASYIAQYRREFFLAIESSFGDPSGEGWYPDGTDACWEVVTPAADDGCTRQRVSDGVSEACLPMNQPETVVIDWTEQSFLEITQPSPSAGLITGAADGWLDTGEIIQLTAEPEENFSFVRWEGIPAGVDDSNPAIEFALDTCGIVSAEFAPDVFVDTDRDGLDDFTEESIGTSPTDKDSDGDGFEDGLEVAIETDPLSADDPANSADADGDGYPDEFDNDPAAVDADGDRFLDRWEVTVGSDPNDPSDRPSLGDANEDGVTEFSDAVTIFNIFLGILSLEDFAPESDLDVNRDGAVDVVDGVVLFNWFLNNLPIIPFG